MHERCVANHFERNGGYIVITFAIGRLNVEWLLQVNRSIVFLTTTIMKYSILGFNQEIVCEIKKTILHKNKYKILNLDVSDLLIIQEIADFMNRKKVIKYTIDDKTYVSIKYDLILEDLPILGIKKQALRDRIDKICELGIMEKKVIVNESGSWTAFRLSDKYEELRYNVDGGVCSQLHRGVYSTTQGCVADYTPKTNNTITNITNNKEEDIKISSKKEKDILSDYDTTDVPEGFLPIIKTWCEYKRDRKQKYKSQKSFQTMVNHLHKLSKGNPHDAKLIVEQSIGNNYAGLFELSNKLSTNNLPLGFKLEDDRNEIMKNQPKQSW